MTPTDIYLFAAYLINFHENRGCIKKHLGGTAHGSTPLDLQFGCARQRGEYLPGSSRIIVDFEIPFVLYWIR
jgi:hypothetical protein